jgi:hypothetical protein
MPEGKTVAVKQADRQEDVFKSGDMNKFFSEGRQTIPVYDE